MFSPVESDRGPTTTNNSSSINGKFSHDEENCTLEDSISRKDDGDNWNFWVEIYKDRRLRRKLSDRAEKHTQLVKELIREYQPPETSTKLYIGNLPPRTKAVDIQDMIEEFTKKPIEEVSLRLSRDTAKVCFYRKEDAELARNYMEGLRYKDHILQADFHLRNTYYAGPIPKSGLRRAGSPQHFRIVGDQPGLISSTEEEDWDAEVSENLETERRGASWLIPDYSDVRTFHSDDEEYFSDEFVPFEEERKAETMASNPCDSKALRHQKWVTETALSDSSFTDFSDDENWEGGTIEQFVTENGPVKFSSDIFDELMAQQSEDVREKFNLWPAGFIRSLSNLTLHGPYLCAGKYQVSTAERLCTIAQEPHPYKESWEPMAPSQITDFSSFLRYLESLLTKFGPLWIYDGLVKLLYSALPEIRGEKSDKIVAEMGKLEQHFRGDTRKNVVFFADTLYPIGQSVTGKFQ